MGAWRMNDIHLKLCKRFICNCFQRSIFPLKFSINKAASLLSGVSRPDRLLLDKTRYRARRFPQVESAFHPKLTLENPVLQRLGYAIGIAALSRR
jgi:hypothetical protein